MTIKFPSGEKGKLLVDLIVLLLLLAMVFLTYGRRVHENPSAASDIPPVVVKADTTVATAPKTSASDNDVEVTQVYRAEVNGRQLTIPIVNTGANLYGTKGVIKQEIDLTPAIKQAAAVEREKAKEEFKKNWEVGAGLGVHESNVYFPVTVQRNYAKDKAIELELHIKADLQLPPKVNGVEVLHKWMLP